jgi:Tfp pilus assembly protein PilO
MTKMRQWSILTVVAVIIVFAAGWFLLVKPQNSKASDLRSQALTQEQQNAVLQSQIATLQSEEKSLPEQQAELRKFSTQVPENAAEPTIIRQLSAAAAGAGVDLVSMTPGTPAAVVSPTVTEPAPTDPTAATGTTSLTGATAAGGLTQLPISIGITGTFPNVESFFQSLETLPRALLVSSWSLCPTGPSAAAASSSSGTGASCTPPSVPTAKALPEGTLGGTLSATIFYAPPAGTVPATGTATTTTPSTTTTPEATPTTAATPAPTTSAATPAATGTTPPPAG